MASQHFTLEFIRPQDVERFWVKVDKSPGQGPKGDCWEWMAGRGTQGYGRFGLRGSIGHRRAGYTQNAQRIAYYLHYRENPGDLEVLHRCDNPPCVNPDHLFLGTNLDNIADRHAKGRTASGVRSGAYTKPDRRVHGESHPRAKLSSDDVITILSRLSSGASQVAIAKDYKVTPAAIWAIDNGKAWKHISRP